MKFFTSQLAFFVKNKTARSNIKRLLVFFLFLMGIILLYSTLFHWLMVYEKQDHSLVTGLYWTLTVMSTLGFGDITFHSDIGRIFSVVVLLSGMIFLLVLLPFTFIEFFYAPWLKAQSAYKTPRELPKTTSGHVLITHLDEVTQSLAEKLKDYHIPYYFLVNDTAKALEFFDNEIPVVLGALDDPETYKKVHIQQAAMLVSTQNDMLNTNITFTVRELNTSIPIVVTANTHDSVDILKLAGANSVIQLGDILGKSLARRVLSENARVHVIGRFHELIIAEALVIHTPFSGKRIIEARLRELFGITIVGIWDRGVFLFPHQDLVLLDSMVLVLAGTIEQFRNYDEMLSIFNSTDSKVIIIGGGRVGRAAARALIARHIDYVIVEKEPSRIRSEFSYIIGSAADLETLQKAGIDEVNTVLITTNDDDINIYLTLYCRKLRPDIQIISRASLERNVSTLHRAGADFVMSYASMGANTILNTLKQAEVLMIAEGLDIFKATTTKQLAGKSLIESEIRKRTGCSVIAVCINGKTIASPPPDFVLPNNSELILAGNSEAERAFMNAFS